MMKLEDYLLGAKKIMMAQKCGYLTQDDDAVGDVAFRMMWADYTWNGKSKPNTWRYNQAVYAIKKIITKRKKQPKHISLSKQISKKDDTMSLGDVIPCKKSYNNEYNDLCEKIDSVLDSRTRDCFYMYYRDNMTFKEIGSKFNFSRQRAEQIVKNGANKVKE